MVLAFRGVTPRTAMLAGCLVLLAGLAVTFVAITTAAAAFLAGAAVAPCTGPPWHTAWRSPRSSRWPPGA